MNRKVFQIAWAALLVVSASLACNFINGIQQDVSEVRNTAVSVMTQAERLITQAEGMATAFDESDAVQTAKAVITEQGPVALATLQALGTQAAESGVLQTAQAVLTEQGPDAQATLRSPDAWAEVIAGVYEILPNPIRLVVNRDIFVTYCLRKLDKIIPGATPIKTQINLPR